MKLTYHQRTFDLLKSGAVISEKHLEHIAALETYYHITSAASVRELFSIEDYERIILGNDDHVLPVDLFQWRTSAVVNHDQRWRMPYIDRKADLWHFWEKREDAAYLPFIVENQGVCIWAIPLNSGDDPPVLVRWDEPDYPWLPCAFTFSDFVYTRAFDDDRKSEGLLIAADEPLSAPTLDYLHRHLKTEPITQSFPQTLSYRFSGQGFRILIITSEGRSDWFISAESQEYLYAGGRAVWHLGNLAESLKAHPDQAVEMNILNRLKSEGGTGSVVTSDAPCCSHKQKM